MALLNISVKTAEILREIRNQNPLIHHITNYVVMNSTANITLAIGASPIMAHSHEEVEEIAEFASVLNLNIGTIDEYWIKSMLIAGEAAGKRGIPIVLDPVGAGATKLRNDAIKQILNGVPISVIRGNASEVMSLAGEAFKIKGVDSLEDVASARDGAIKLARNLSNVVAITGVVDFVTDGNVYYEVYNGHPMFGTITGTGCAATTAISCFNAVEKDAAKATACALGYYGLAGEIAAEKSNGPGSFQAALYDALYSLHKVDFASRIKIRKFQVKDD